MRAKELSVFCMQVSFLLSAGIPLDGGITIIGEDASSSSEKKMLFNMAEEIGLGISLADSLDKTGQFPQYVIKMAKLGQETGTLESVMSSLSDYYARENSLTKTIKNAITYPMVMVFMLVTVLFILLTKVMPIFEDVYRQLGTEISPITKAATSIGSFISGAILVSIIILGIVSLILFITSKNSGTMKIAEKILDLIKEKSSIAEALSKRRFAAILETTVKSGLDSDKAIDLSSELISNKRIAKKIEIAKEETEGGMSLYEALKRAEIFPNMDLQLIKVGSKSGKLDVIFKELSEKYEMEVDEAIDNMIGKFEPTMVVTLAIVVGMILLAVMMPLVGIMASIG